MKSEPTSFTCSGIFDRFDSSLPNVLNSIQKFQFTYRGLKHFLHPAILECSRITSSTSSGIFILSCIQGTPILLDMLTYLTIKPCMLSRVSSSKTRRNRTWNLRSMQCWRPTTENFSEKWRVGYSPSFVFDSGKTGNTWKYRNRTGSCRNMEQRTLPIPCHSIEIREKVLFQRDDRFYRWKYRLPYTAVGQRNFYFTCREHKT